MSSQQEPSFSEPDYAKADNAKEKQPYYLENIDKYLLPETQELLEKYSKIPLDQQSKHIHDIRDKAWAIRKYPCTGLGTFLTPYMPHSQSYWAILERLKSNETFLDIGCHLGVDMRRMTYDGAPSSTMTGIDIVNHWDIGYELFNDKENFNAKFIEADILSDDSALLSDLQGKVNIISISAVLHQWDWDDQVKVAKKIVSLSMPGSIVVGHQIGNVGGQRVKNQVLGTWQFAHNPESFRKLWEQVGKETGTFWHTNARFLKWEDMGWDEGDMDWLGEGATVIDFVVIRDQ